MIIELINGPHDGERRTIPGEYASIAMPAPGAVAIYRQRVIRNIVGSVCGVDVVAFDFECYEPAELEIDDD